jgi:hypothetical protein
MRLHDGTHDAHQAIVDTGNAGIEIAVNRQSAITLHKWPEIIPDLACRLCRSAHVGLRCPGEQLKLGENRQMTVEM